MTVTFEDLNSNYSSSDPSSARYVSQRDLFNEIGWGEFIGRPEYHNTCAIRVSLAFVKSGKNITPRSHSILAGPHKGQGVQVAMRRLADLLARNNYLGTYESFTPQTARTGIGARRGVVAFNNIPGFSGGGHIDLVLGAADAARCASGCYYQSETIWFWPLQAGRAS